SGADSTAGSGQGNKSFTRVDSRGICLGRAAVEEFAIVRLRFLLCIWGEYRVAERCEQCLGCVVYLDTIGLHWRRRVRATPSVSVFVDIPTSRTASVQAIPFEKNSVGLGQAIGQRDHD